LRASLAVGEETAASQSKSSHRADAEPKGPQAAVHHSAYLAALAKHDWAGALQELVKAIKLDARQFTPFPTGKYQLQRILGADEFGVAFLCKHKFLDAQVVVKALRFEKRGRDADKVFAEAQALRQLDHPTILRVADCGYVDAGAKSRPFLVMDHFPGPTLQEHVQKHGPMPFGELLEVARQMADGLLAAHGKNILHRSVNPGSLLIRKEGEAWRAKLIDFGLAPRKRVGCFS
jgi:serine/threonine protein kinase